MTYKNNFCGSKKLPKAFFFSSGIGESDHAASAGAKTLAMKKAGVYEYRLTNYPKILPENLKEVTKPQDLHRGSEMSVILAEANCEAGQEAAAGIMTAKLYRKTSGKDCGSIACDFGGNFSKEQLYEKLKLILTEIYEEGYSAEYELGEPRAEISHISPKLRFGSAVVALCFSDAVDHYRPQCEVEHRFLGFRFEERKAKYAIQPVPFESAQTGASGTKEAPCAILAASLELEPYHIETDQKTYLAGFHTKGAIQGSSSAEIVDQVKASTLDTLQKKQFPVLIGGGHNISIGAFYAMNEHYGRDFSVLQLDSQTDLRKSFDGDLYSSACVMTHAKKCTDSVMQVGIRSMSSPEKDIIDYDAIAFASDIHADPLWIEDAMADLKEKVYLTIDLSVFDSSYLVTAKPTPGGLYYQQVIKLIKEVAKKHTIVGVDVTELIPVMGNHAGEFFAARLVYDILSYIEAYRK